MPPRSRTLAAEALLVVVLLVTSLGGYAVSAALEEPGRAAVTFDGLRLRPLSGWASAGTADAAGWTLVRLTRGTGTLDVAVRAAPVSGSGAAAIGYVDEVLRGSLTRLSVSGNLESVSTSSGLQGVRFTYTGVVTDTRQAIEGEVTVTVSPSGRGVAFDAWTPSGHLAFVLGDAHAMIDRTEVVS